MPRGSLVRARLGCHTRLIERNVASEAPRDLLGRIAELEPCFRWISPNDLAGRAPEFREDERDVLLRLQFFLDPYARTPEGQVQSDALHRALRRFQAGSKDHRFAAKAAKLFPLVPHRPDFGWGKALLRGRN